MLYTQLLDMSSLYLWIDCCICTISFKIMIKLILEFLCHTGKKCSISIKTDLSLSFLSYSALYADELSWYHDLNNGCTNSRSNPWCLVLNFKFFPQIRDYAPDLAKTIAGLILSSNDLNFKEECFSLVGLQFQNSEANIIEDCIKDRLISVIGINDRKRKRNREPKALLFEDCFFQSDFLEGEHEEGDEVLSSLDL